MAITPTYPGVYVEELPSGVRTIAGVSTSVTVFIGAAKRGPIDKATPVRSWADYERRFGGLDVSSEMSYSVRQFFNNGGSEAIIIRVAANVSTASREFLYVPADATKKAIEISAADAGKAGNAIEIGITHTTDPNGFGITATLVDPANPLDEKFDNLSLNSRSPRYAESVVNNTSELIRVKRSAITFDQAATSVSGEIEAAQLAKIDADHNQFRLSLNGGEPITIVVAAPVPTLADLAAKIKADALSKGTGDEYGPDFNVQQIGTTKRIRITSGKKGEFASVRILPGLTKDIAGILKLGADNGGVDTDGTAPYRPAVSPAQPFLVSGIFNNGDFELPASGKEKFKITLGGVQKEIDLTDTSVTNTGGNVAEKLALLASHITTTTRAADASAAFTGFTASVHPDGTRLIFTSGSGGPSSTITLNTGSADDALVPLHFADAATATGALIRLQNGNDAPYDDGNLEAIFRGSRSARTGLYALESTDIFNIVCMPGITNLAVIGEMLAYCEERRAFLIADPPAGKKPDQMKTSAQTYPKHRNVALYYPLIGISDQLQGGIIRMLSPSGTMAGVMARTDAQRGVWKAPAGIDASLVGVQKLEYVLTDAENGVLNPRAVNCLRLFPNYGAVSWGARTQVGDDERGDDWKYIPVRRLALYIEESLYRGTKWAVFEPNDEPLWAQLRMNIGAFMHDLFRQGAFAGSSPRDAYLVKCDKDTTTQTDVNRGIVNVLIGFAPLKPAEFVFLKIQQLAGQLSA